MCLWRCFWMRWISGKGDYPSQRGWTSCNWQKTWEVSEKENLLSLPIFKLGHHSFLAFRLGLRMAPTSWALLHLRPSHSNWNYIIDSPGSPACPLQILGLPSFHSHPNQFLIINLHYNKSLSFLLSLDCQLHLVG